MTRPTPYVFCRYAIQIDDDLLDAVATVQALNEVQGRFLPHGRKAEQEGNNSIVVMQPSTDNIQGEDVVTWKIGYRAGSRTVTDYDVDGRQLTHQVENDRHIIHTDIVAIPRLGVMAVNDRTNSMHMGAKPALSRPC